jgi:DNA-binding GntR family transcriptional regulator
LPVAFNKGHRGDVAAGNRRSGRGSPALPPGAEKLGLADRAWLMLQEMIVTLELPPGSVWSEAELSRRTGIGRTPVREALQRLEADHLVVIVRRHGARVAEVNIEQQLMLLELRRELEGLIATRAARRRSNAEQKRFLDLAKELRRVGRSKDVVAFLRLHDRASRFAASCARNRFAAAAMAPCVAMSHRFYSLHYRHAQDLDRATRFHADVMESIAAGDEKRAAAAAERLMDYVERYTRATVDEQF